MHMDLDTNMKMAGKRYPSYASYKVRPHVGTLYRIAGYFRRDFIFDHRLQFEN